MIRSHPLTTDRLNYTAEDAFHILKSDVFADRPDEDIHAYIQESLTLYDQLEVES